MRIKSLPVLATAIAALLTLTACGSDGGENPAFGGMGQATGATSSKEKGFKGLPKAGSMAAAARIVNMYTDCSQVRPLLDSYDGSDGDPNSKYDESYSVTERGYCDSEGSTSIVMIKDAKVFQTAYKAEIDKENGGGNADTGPVVGQDFAAGSDDADVMVAMVAPHTGLMVLNCYPNFNPPSGYRKEPALVKGCFLTDYFKD
ncbi:hypothetical protein OHA37_22070 [Streptomyces sp. NBC_00335]|uniref:hypothetical protein n=1 Tax=unclassified Streptomyces TaxID=2593676 RepID=UPI002254638E|nr:MULTISPECIES: hypothetical protein [unclassified Streptomyces]MCX5406549.1 hypothetical protein [Streptomyces sp. NBC_00086]